MAPQLFLDSLATRLRRIVKQKPPVPVIDLANYFPNNH